MKKPRHNQPQFRLSPLCAAVLLATAMQAAQANPTGGSVVSGEATFSTSGNTFTVTNTPGTIIHWQDFSNGANEITRFVQQSATSTVLNRVVSSNPSNILGSLQSNGRVFLVNPNGIIFGMGATIDVAGLVATSLNLSDDDFIAGRHRYTEVPGAQKISNAGNITAQSGGQIYLIAPDVENTGVITAPNGEILLVAGHSVELVDSSEPSLRVNITAAAGDATNVGQLVAEAGSLGLFGTVVKNTGTVSADSATLQGGKIVFKASQRAEISGTVSANGTTGGLIEVLGDQVGIMDGASLSADGAQGGGTILVGGDYQGKNPEVQNATVTYVAATATLSADATDSGDGGKVIVWADDTARAYGSISARGGNNGGNGGFIETSGHYLDVAGIKIDAAAVNGQAGTWLLDPWNVTITSADLNGAFAGGTWTPSNTLSTVSAATIATALDAGTSIIITTTGAGNEDGNITVASNIAKTAGASTTLSLVADNDIIINTGISISSTSNALNVMLNADSDGNGGAILMSSGSSIVSNGGSITLGGGANPLTTGATGNASYVNGVYLVNATLNAGAGNISVRGTGVAGTSNINSGIKIGTGSLLQTTSGSITLNGTGGAGAGTYSSKYGILLDGGTIQSATGSISLTGTGGASGTFSNMGVYLAGGAITSTVSAPITITGVGGAGSAGLNYGVLLAGGASGLTISSVNGAVSIDGTAAGTTVGSEGIRAFGFGQPISISSTGTAPISFTGTGTLTSSSIFFDGTSGAISVGGNQANGDISFDAAGTIAIVDAQVTTNGNMTADIGGNLSITASGSQALLKAGGTQTINFTGAGAHTLTLTGSNSNVAGAAASIMSTGLQTITNAGTLAINLTGGSGVANTQNATNSSGTICTSCATFNDARIQSSGGQTISATTITLQGGSGGDGNHASIENKSTSVAQNITTTGAISLTGGTGGQYYAASNDTVSNDAGINSDGTQIINAGSIAMVGGGNTSTIGGAFLSGKVSQVITTSGNLSMTGGAGNTAGQYGLGAVAVIGEELDADITLNIGGSLTMVGGSGSASGVLIGSAQGTPEIDITASSISMTAGAGSVSRIGVLTGGPAGALTMAASGGISQDATSSINTSTLSASSSGAAINLAGANLINTVSSLSAYGNVSYTSAQTVHIGSATSSTGIVTLATAGAGHNLYLGTASGEEVNVTSAGGIYDDNGSGTNNITATTSSTLVSTGATLGDMGISMDVNTPSITATVSGSYGGVSIRSASATAPTTIALTDSATVTPQGVSYSHSGANTLVLDGTKSFSAGSGGVTIKSSGDMTYSGSSISSTGTTKLEATGTLNVNSNLSVSGGLTMDAATINLTGAGAAAGTDVNATASGNIRLNNGGHIYASNEVFLTLSGASSTLYLNDTAGMANDSYILANAPSTTYLKFPARSSGGVVIDGVETLNTSVGGSGFFTGTTSTPAVQGAGLVVTYGIASTVVNSIVNEVVVIPTGFTSNDTTTLDSAGDTDSTEEEKKDAPVVEDASAPVAEDTSTASLPVCK